MSFTFHLIWTYLKARKGFTGFITWASVLGITLGVAALITVMGVMAGFRAELLERMLGLSGHITVFAEGLSVEQLPDLQESLSQHPQVLSAQGLVNGQVMIHAGNITSGAIVRGQEIDAQLRETANLLAGEWAALAQPNVIAIGEGLARKLGVSLGSALTLITPDGAQTPFGFIPRIVHVKIGAIFDTGLGLYDDALILSSLATAQNLFRLGQQLSAIEVKVQNPLQDQVVMADLRDFLPQYVVLQSWREGRQSLLQALQIERVTMFVILSLIILVAAFNIVTGQIMLVTDKAGDIAILRTMGATQADILKIFFGNGMLLGALGTLAGFGLGLLLLANLHAIEGLLEVMTGTDIFSSDVYPVDELPARFVWPEFLSVLAVSLILTLLASLYPAWRAARQHPVEALKYA